MKKKCEIEDEITKRIADVQDAKRRMDEAQNQLVFDVYRLQMCQLNAKIETLRWMID